MSLRARPTGEWGLRDYGTGSWNGGNPDCDHAPVRGLQGKSESSLRADRTFTGSQPQGQTCTRCGASRVDQQLGLEPTPEAYVDRMVNVFREVRRVLRTDGTLWLNIGSSYLANPSGGLTGSTLTKGGKQTLSSRAAHEARRDAAPRDTACIAPQDSPATDSACLDLCGECAAELWNHNPHTLPPPHASGQPSSSTSPDSAPPGSSSPLEQRDAPVSTTPGSSPQPPALCWRCATRPASVALQVGPTFAPDAQASAHTDPRTNGSEQPLSDGRNQGTDDEGMAWVNYTSRLKPKDMVPIPWMLAMALQADGWYLRSDVIWSKSNPMPESVTDRPTKAHEYLFLLTKSPKYFYDQDAIREPHSPDGRLKTVHDHGTPNSHPNYDNVGNGNERWPNGGRNRRSVWEVATEAYPDAHFATYPQALIEPCIKAGCPEHVCQTCGKPRERIVEVESSWADRAAAGAIRGGTGFDAAAGRKGGGNQNAVHGAGVSHDLDAKRRETTGWSDCGHNNYTPGVVLDPFLGSGTTALVARKHSRHSIGIELNPTYAELAAKRLNQLSLLTGTDA